MDKETEIYLAELKSKIANAYVVANKARAEHKDPDVNVEALPVGDLAARVEGLVGPKGIASKIREVGRRNISKIVDHILGDLSSLSLTKEEKEARIDQALRTSLAIITEGVVAAPIEGISKVCINSNPDGSEYLSVYFAGPIRSAGGTAQGYTIVISDYIRKRVGLQDYRPTNDELERYVEEIKIYNDRVSRLQYLPSEDDIRHIVRNVSVCIDGDPTEKRQVSVHRDLKRVNTNRIRGGMCLVIAEGIAQKARRIMKHAANLGLDWNWLSEIKKGKGAGDDIKTADFMSEIVGGRPIFAAPSAKGAFRLRYGRSRTSGIAGKSIHPATMLLLDEFIATGTQVKVERPGKGCVITECDSIDGPVVKLKNGSIVRIETVEQAKMNRGKVSEILFLGDILITYGDFLQTNTALLPAGYCEEYWVQEVKDKLEKIPKILSADEAVDIAKRYEIPLHPRYIYHWEDISIDDLQILVDWLCSGSITDNRLIVKNNNPDAKTILEILCVPHDIEINSNSVLIEEYLPLLNQLGIYDEIKFSRERFDISFREFNSEGNKTAFDLIEKVSLVKVRKKIGTYIGARMGRPEKARERKMEPPVHALFPVGWAGGKERSINSAAEKNFISVEIVRYECPNCRISTMNPICHECGKNAIFKGVSCRDLEIGDMWKRAVASVGTADVKGVHGMISKYKIPEPLEKGILRAKNDVYVFKDGTIRFDATNVPSTHFKAREIGIGIERLHELGYTEDYLGNELSNDEQIVEIKIQDVVLPIKAANYLVRVAQFMDELLQKFYEIEPFYNVKTKEDLLGHLILGLAPHTSAGIVGRIIGFTRANVCFAHPYWHAAKRRNCFFGDEKIPVYDGQEFKILTIRELVERNLIGEVERDDFGTEYKKIVGLKTFALNKKTKKFELADITHVSKHLAPEKLIEIKTKSGRKIIVTPEHYLPNKYGKKVHAMDATEVLVPWHIENPVVQKAEKIDLLEVINDQEVMIRTEEGIFDEEIPLSQISNNLGLNYKTFTNYVYRKSYPLEIVWCFNQDIIKNKDYLLGSKRDKVSLKPEVLLNEDFLCLLGFYLAEGYIKKNQKDTHQVSITAAKSWAKEFLREKIRSIFGLEASISGHVITMCSRFIYELFHYLEIGENAKNKRVPNFIYTLPKEKMSAFLRGYFSGDGSCSLQSTLEVNVTSVNKWLIDSISMLLMFLGVKHSIYEESREIKSDLILEFYGKPKPIHAYKIRIYSDEARKFIEKIGFIGEKQILAQKLLKKWLDKKGVGRTNFEGEVFIDKIVEKECITNKERYVYNITVDTHHNLICSGIVAENCDGDEDAIMLLLDVLTNFSRKYLPERHGGQMDAPLVISTILDPKEVDDEVHKMEIVDHYPLEFYRKTWEYANPSDVDIEIVSSILNSNPYSGLRFTHDTGDINGPVTESRYLRLKTMKEKVDAQLKVAEKVRAISEKQVAELVINSHLLRDTYGNLRAFAKQKFRCVKCNKSYRRVPLIGKCTNCGGKLLLTVSEGSVRKYLDISMELVEKYNLSDYLKQRLILLKREIDSLFTNDLSKQMNLGDFM